MHETSIAISIYRAARNVLKQHNGRRLESVRVAVGELSALEPDLLEFAWQAVTQDGPDSKARLEIEWRPAHQVCPRCGESKARSSGSWLRLCGSCGQPLHVKGGQELDLLQVTIETLETNPRDPNQY